MPSLTRARIAAACVLLALACQPLASAQTSAQPKAAPSPSKKTPSGQAARPAAAKASSKTTGKSTGKTPAARGAASPTAAAAATSAASAAKAADTTAVAATPSPSTRQADYIVAIVNSEPVTNHEVRAGMQRIQQQIRQQGMAAPSQDELRQLVLERLIAERAQLQFARESGLDVDDQTLAQAELSIARQNQLDSVQQLHERLQHEGLSLPAFRDDLRNQILLSRLRERQFDPRQRVTDSEVDAFIRERTGAAVGAPAINLAMILIAVPENADSAEVARLQARANEALARLKAGEDFAQVARAYSDAHQRGEDGGVLGLRPADQYPSLFVQATRGLRVGEVAGPLKSDAGFHLLKLVERQQSGDLPEVKIPQTRARHILLTIDPRQGQALALERANDFRRRILSGQASFEDLARQHSQDGSAADGGDLDWTSPGQFVPEFEQAMNQLDIGQISEPVVSRFGVHLIRVDERREKVLTTAEQRELARNMLREKKAEDAFEAWAREVRGRAYVEYRDPPQ